MLNSFPTRRSSDLNESDIDGHIVCVATLHVGRTGAVSRTTIVRCFEGPDGRVARKRHLGASSRGHVPRHKWWVGGAERIYGTKPERGHDHNEIGRAHV